MVATVPGFMARSWQPEPALSKALPWGVSSHHPSVKDSLPRFIFSFFSQGIVGGPTAMSDHFLSRT